MKLIWCLLLFSYVVPATGQTSTASEADKQPWDWSVSLNNYVFNTEYIFNPVVAADYSGLHLEGRYNYEDLRTISLFAGYSFDAGGSFSIQVIPMLGFAAGQTSGIIPAAELTLSWGAFEWYNESEYLIHPGQQEENYFYAWSELTYTPLDRLFVGLAASRTRLYHSSAAIQRGFGLGYDSSGWTAGAYLMNLGLEDPFLYFSVSLNLP
jgi:hypothetical protein